MSSMGRRMSKKFRVKPKADGIEWWRCPDCKDLKVQLRYQKPAPGEALPPPDSTLFCCMKCGQVWSATSGAIYFGSRAEAAVEQVKRKQALLYAQYRQEQ